MDERSTSSRPRSAAFTAIARNVAELGDTPNGKAGRKSRSLSLVQGKALLDEASKPKHRLGAYIILAVMSGLRTEELRTLKWSDVDLDKATVYVLRADRHKGETKTTLSRRGLGIADIAVEALRSLKTRQAAERLKADEAHQEHDVVFCREDGRPYAAPHVRYGSPRCPRRRTSTSVSGARANYGTRSSPS